jgi:hypothetical protein
VVRRPPSDARTVSGSPPVRGVPPRGEDSIHGHVGGERLLLDSPMPSGGPSRSTRPRSSTPTSRSSSSVSSSRSR